MEIFKVVLDVSKSGSTKLVHTIYYDVTSANTLAAGVLLKRYYQLRDVDNDGSHAKRIRKKIKFSQNYLTKIKAEKGVLSCTYCPRTNLIIEKKGKRIPDSFKATIDHIIPISNGGARYDEKNICVCCGKCNSKKGSKSVEEFLQKDLVI